jgi:hypothetical protein
VRLGQAARARAEDCFDIRQAAAGLVRQYRDMIAQAGC